jgi:Na+/H+-translocating membrane pyrophosphatase
MSNDSDNSLASRAALAAGAAIGSAAIAAALLFVKRRSDRKKADGQPGATGTAPHYPEATD